MKTVGLFILSFIFVSCIKSPSVPTDTSQGVAASPSAVEKVKPQNQDVQQSTPQDDAQKQEQLASLEQQKQDIEADIANTEAKLDEANQQMQDVQAASQQGPAGIATIAAKKDDMEQGFAAVGIGASAIQDLIEAIIDLDVAGIIDAIMDLIGGLEADLAAQNAALDQVNAQIDAIK